jgi:hypothetical protein
MQTPTNIHTLRVSCRHDSHDDVLVCVVSLIVLFHDAEIQLAAIPSGSAWSIKDLNCVAVWMQPGILLLVFEMRLGILKGRSTDTCSAGTAF